MGANIAAVEYCTVASGVHSVGQEYEDQVVCRVNPEDCAGKTEMSENLRGCFIASRGVIGIFDIRFVEAEAAPASGAFVGRKKPGSLGLEDLFSSVRTAVEKHLTIFGNVVGVAEKAGIALDAT